MSFVSFVFPPNHVTNEKPLSLTLRSVDSLALTILKIVAESDGQTTVDEAFEQIDHEGKPYKSSVKHRMRKVWFRTDVGYVNGNKIFQGVSDGSIVSFPCMKNTKNGFKFFNKTQHAIRLALGIHIGCEDSRPKAWNQTRDIDYLVKHLNTIFTIKLGDKKVRVEKTGRVCMFIPNQVQACSARRL